MAHEINNPLAVIHAESHHGKLYLDRTSPHTKFVLEIPKALAQASMEAG